MQPPSLSRQVTKDDLIYLHAYSTSIEAHTFGCENRTESHLEVILDLSRVKNFSNSSVTQGKHIIAKVIPPACYAVITSIRKNEMIEEFEEASDEEVRQGQQQQPTKLDIDFKHKRVTI